MISSLKHVSATIAALRLFATAEPDPNLWTELRSNGIDLDLVTNLAGPIVRTLATFSPEGWFQYDNFGEVAFAMAVHGEDAETVIDLVAWSARDPAVFGTLFDAEILGLDTLMNPATYIYQPCCLFGSPLAWLQADCTGAVLLNDQAAQPVLEEAPGPFTADSMEFAEYLFRAGIVPASRVLVPSTWRDAA